MRVLLVSANRLKAPQTVLPMGLCQVASAAETAGHVVRLLDLCFDRDPLQSTRLAVREFDPDAVGISIRNLDNSDSQSAECYLDDAAALAREIKHVTPAPVVLGGPAVSIAPEMVLDYVGGDYAVVGEGEKAFPALLEAIERYGTVPRVHRADAHEMAAPSHLPFAMLRRLPLARYSAYGTPAPIQTRRGCPRKCAYCTYPSIEGSQCRLKPACEVVEEIREAESLRIFDSAEFVDSIFTDPVEHTVEVCQEIGRAKFSIPLHTTSVNPGDGTPGLFRLMERAGFEAVSVSIESASDDVLQGLGKGYSVSDVAQTVRAAHLASMARIWTFMFGGPGETERTVNETLDYIRKYLDGRDLLLVNVGIRIYPGTRLEEIARREGVLTGGEDLLRPTFYFSPAIGRERLVQMIRGAGLCCATTILGGDLSCRALPILNRLYRRMRLRPPYWQHVRPLLKIKNAIGGLRRMK